MPFDPFYDNYSAGKTGHGCFGKIKAIIRRTGVVLSHDEITFLCEHVWNCRNADEFYEKMNGMSDSELKDYALKAKLRKKPSLLEHEAMLYA